MEIGRSIKIIREKKNISQRELSTFTGISPTSLSQMEGGTKRPSEQNLVKICSALNVPISAVYALSIDVMDVSKAKRETLFILRDAMIKLLIPQ